MMMVLRRLLAAAAVATALVIGSGAMVAQAAPTPSPTASATNGTPAATAPSDDNGDPDLNLTPDAAVDNTRIVWVLGGVGLVAVIAAAVVIARR
jgi:hypothetical protein